MNTKVIIYIIIGFIAAYFIGTVLLKGMAIGAAAGNDSKTTDPSNTKKQPTIEELKAKGYDDSEITAIIASELYKKGEWSF